MAGKKFKFALANVLKLREHECEQARQALLAISADRQAQEANVEEARLRFDAVLQTLPSGPSGPSMLRRHDAHRRDAQLAFEASCRKLALLQEQEARARRHLIEKKSIEEALQTLYEKQKAAFLKEQQDAEAAFLDEQAISGYYRKNIAPHS